MKAVAVLGLWIAVVVWLLVLGTAHAQTTPDLAEEYTCSGEGPDGRYQLSLDIERRGENYFLGWDHGRIAGMGFRDGDRLVAALVDARTSGVAVAAYEIRPKQLIGRWAVGDGLLFAEECLVGPKGVSAQLR